MKTEALLSGKAIGGPRDGVKLSAAPRWDGLVKYRRSKNSDPTNHPGNYSWNGENWVWNEDTNPQPPRRR